MTCVQHVETKCLQDSFDSLSHYLTTKKFLSDFFERQDS